MSGIASIDGTGLKAWLEQADKPLLLDVRMPGEHEFVRIEGSVLIPLPELPNRLEELAGFRGKPLVAYCHHGVRSHHALQFLQSQGFTDLHNLSGGIDSWSAEVDHSLPRY